MYLRRVSTNPNMQRELIRVICDPDTINTYIPHRRICIYRYSRGREILFRKPAQKLGKRVVVEGRQSVSGSR